jgi:hypothetical protein
MTGRDLRSGSKRDPQETSSGESIVPSSVSDAAPPSGPSLAKYSIEDLMAELQLTREEQRRAQVQQSAEREAERVAHVGAMRALEETVANLQHQIARGRPAGGASLEQMADVHSFPVGICDSGFSVRALQTLPAEISDVGVPLLDVRGHELVLAAA